MSGTVTVEGARTVVTIRVMVLVVLAIGVVTAETVTSDFGQPR